jgi:acyl carrier protein
MNQQEIISQIEQIIGDIAATKGLEAPRIYPDTQLLGTGLPIDSLDLASLIVELESITGYDPFHGSFINFRTAGELAQLYQMR